MVKLQRHKAYTYESDDGKKIEHFKHLVVIPENVVSEIGWPDGTELDVSVSENVVVLKPESKGRKK